jgi:hypothetical protein
MADVGQTGVSGEQSRRFTTVNDDEFSRILTEIMSYSFSIKIKARFTDSFPIFAPNTHKLYIYVYHAERNHSNQWSVKL